MTDQTVDASKNQTHFHLPPLTQAALMETCVNGTSYDYFSQSEVSFILSFTSIGLAIASFIGIFYLFIKHKERQQSLLRIQENKATRNSFRHVKHIDDPVFVGL